MHVVLLVPFLGGGGGGGGDLLCGGDPLAEEEIPRDGGVCLHKARLLN